MQWLVDLLDLISYEIDSEAEREYLRVWLAYPEVSSEVKVIWAEAAEMLVWCRKTMAFRLVLNSFGWSLDIEEEVMV